MRARLPISAAIVCLALMGGAASAEARSSYCSPTGDYCMQVVNRSGRVYLRIATFSFRSYTLCVTPPRGGGECDNFRLRSAGSGLYSSSVRWSLHFRNAGHGKYAVRWKVGGSRLGPVLSFRR